MKFKLKNMAIIVCVFAVCMVFNNTIVAKKFYFEHDGIYWYDCADCGGTDNDGDGYFDDNDGDGSPDCTDDGFVDGNSNYKCLPNGWESMEQFCWHNNTCPDTTLTPGGTLNDEITSPGGTDIAGNVDSKISTPIMKMWNTVRYILQICAVGLFVYSGARYMLASAEQKADMKSRMMMLMIGSVLVFGATLVIKFVQTVVSDILQY